MQIEQSLNGSPPLVFAPSGIDSASLGHGHDIAIERLSINRGVIANHPLNRKVTISGQAQRLMALTLEIREQGQTNATLADIPFEVTSAPAHEVIFNSEKQNTPWNFLLRINSATGQLNLDFTPNYAGLNVDTALAGVRFYDALAREGEFVISGRHPITGELLSLARGNIPQGSYESGDARFVKVLHDLAFIQNKTGVSFTVPERHIKSQEANLIAATAKILRTGHAQYKAEPWVSISNFEQARSALESYAGERTNSMALHYEGEVVKIFGSHVPLGPVTLFCAHSYITKHDLETLRKDLEVAAPGSSFHIRFTPFKECPIEARYIKWLSTEEAEAMKRLPMFAEAERVDEDGWTLPQMNPDAAVALLKSWYEEDVDEQKKSWEALKAGLDEDRLSDRKLFQ